MAHQILGRSLPHRMHPAHGGRVLPQRQTGVRGGVLHHILRGAVSHHIAPRVTAFGPEVNQPVRGANHVQVVLDHDQRMAGILQLAHGAHQLGNVVKVQARGGLVKHEQRAALGRGLAAGRAAFGRLGQKACQLEALSLAAAERRHGLTQFHVVQAHIHDGLQGADHIAVVLEQLGGFADREIQDICHVQGARNGVSAPCPLNRHLQNLGTVTFAIAIRAAQIHIA